MAHEVQRSDMTTRPVQLFGAPFPARRAEFERLFDSLLGLGSGRFPTIWDGSHRDALVPNIDVRETEAAFVIEAELPGIEEKDVSITLNNGILTLKGEKKSTRDENKDDYHLIERSYGNFQRSFQLADAVDANRVTATFSKGILVITLPKRLEALKGEKRIDIAKG